MLIGKKVEIDPQLLINVWRMRQFQRKWFKGDKSRTTLEGAKHYERETDNLLLLHKKQIQDLLKMQGGAEILASEEAEREQKYDGS